MTTIVTRLYSDAKTAETAVTALKLQNHPDENIDTISSGSGAKAAMVAAQVPDESAAAYSKAMKSGNTLVVVRAPVVPFGAARNAIDTLDEFEAMDAGVQNENVYLSGGPQGDMMLDLKVDRSHRYWATWGNERRRGRVSDAFGIRTLSPYKTHRSCYTGENKYFANFIMGHLSKRKPPSNAVFHGTKFFADFLVPHLSRRVPNVKVS